jgi:hypothetical protein
MSQEKLSNSEIIRRFALIHLTRFPEGIRFVDLKGEVEQSLSEHIPPDDYNNGSYRSALWDISKRYPQYVTKESLGRKNVILRPTQKLFDEVSNISIPDLEKPIEDSNEDEETLSLTDQLVAALQEVEKALSKVEILDVEEIFMLAEGAYKFPYMSDEEFDMLVGLRQIKRTVDNLLKK